ncbi:hypothetical protein BB561_005130 [Smittium simulii]|uniref:thioredoxin-dependent peroxiredoxin n=1 Tax=Smittium simulii TaxID=133385 RepID=A0A2T9YC05_9FUNG|nr:hypothetical protein BB561_005130 [Smittium simulii]
MLFSYSKNPLFAASRSLSAASKSFSSSAFRATSAAVHAQQQAFVRHPAPNFKAQAVVNQQFKEVSLADYKGKFVALVFYPMDFTFVCPTELLAYSEHAAKFAELNTQVLAISTDTEHSHLAWTNLPVNKGGLGSDLAIPLVSDKTHSISKQYGVLVEDIGVALRGLFIIDDKGILRIAHLNDLPVGRNVSETIRLLEAIQFTDKHGEVCPANWSKGKPTIKPSPSASQEYFKSL